MIFRTMGTFQNPKIITAIAMICETSLIEVPHKKIGRTTYITTIYNGRQRTPVTCHLFGLLTWSLSGEIVLPDRAVGVGVGVGVVIGGATGG